MQAWRLRRAAMQPHRHWPRPGCATRAAHAGQATVCVMRPLLLLTAACVPPLEGFSAAIRLRPCLVAFSDFPGISGGRTSGPAAERPTSCSWLRCLGRCSVGSRRVRCLQGRSAAGYGQVSHEHHAFAVHARTCTAVFLPMLSSPHLLISTGGGERHTCVLHAETFRCWRRARVMRAACIRGACGEMRVCRRWKCRHQCERHVFVLHAGTSCCWRWAGRRTGWRRAGAAMRRGSRRARRCGCSDGSCSSSCSARARSRSRRASQDVPSSLYVSAPGTCQHAHAYRCSISFDYYEDGDWGLHAP